MLEFAGKSVTVSHLPMKAIWSLATVGSFVWLLSRDLIHPLVIYLLQLYLKF